MSRKKLIITSIVLVLILVIGGILAYFTDVDTKTNNLKLGQVNIEVVETLWDAQLASAGATGLKDLMPGQEVTKDPVIHNEGASPVYAFAEVSIPTANVAVATGDVSASAVELFNYTWGTNWTPIESETEITAPDATGIGYTKYILAYTNGTNMQELAADASTTSVFANNTITLKNITETTAMVAATSYKSIQNADINITVKGYGIQTEGIGATKTPAAVWALVD